MRIITQVHGIIIHTIISIILLSLLMSFPSPFQVTFLAETINKRAKCHKDMEQNSGKRTFYQFCATVRNIYGEDAAKVQ